MFFSNIINGNALVDGYLEVNSTSSFGNTLSITNGGLNVVGNSALQTISSGTWNGTRVNLAYGGTNNDLSSTVGYLKQLTTGANITTVSTIPASDITGLYGDGYAISSIHMGVSNIISGDHTCYYSSDNGSGVPAFAAWLSPFSGCIVGISWRFIGANATTEKNQTGGSATFQIRKNGSNISGCSATANTNGVAKGYASFSSWSYLFSPGDEIDLHITQSSFAIDDPSGAFGVFTLFVKM